MKLHRKKRKKEKKLPKSPVLQYFKPHKNEDDIKEYSTECEEPEKEEVCREGKC